MGSHIMEPEDLAAFAKNIRWKNLENITSICTSLDRIHGHGTAFQSNPLTFALPLLLAQFSLASASILVASLFLKPLGQPFFAAQMLGGIILGPSGLGQIDSFLNAVFPLQGFVMLDILSTIAYMMYFFLVGVELDKSTLMKVSKRTIVTGIAASVVPLALTEGFSFLLVHAVHIEPSLANKIPIVAQAESALAVPTVAYLLGQLGIVNSELGRTALRSSLISGIFSFTVTLSVILAGQSLRDKKTMIITISAGLVFTAVIAFVVRPVIFLVMKNIPVGTPMSQGQFVALVIMVLISGFLSHAVGLHIYYGPFLLGIAIPVDPQVGSALKQKLGFAATSILLPFFFMKNGLVVNLFQIKAKNYLVLQSIALVAAIGKFVGAFSAFLYYKTPTIDAFLLGLFMTAQGLLELGLFKLMKRDEVIDNEAFTIMCISMLLITGFVTPIIKWLYDPSRQHLVYKRRSMTNSRTNTELRLMICLHGEEHVPTTINFLETLNPTLAKPISVITLHLVETLGLEKPLLVSHKPTENPSEPVFKAFKNYEEVNSGTVSVSTFTGIAPSVKMHDDACSLAIDERISLILVPYKKRFHPNGARRSPHKAASVMNKNLLDKSPCSVGVLVDRGLVKSSRPDPQLGSWSPFRVGVVFLGGDDDREALVIGERMSDHPNIRLTLIRLLVTGHVAGNDTEARKLDNESLSEFRQSMSRNSKVTYIEEVVTDWSGTMAVLRSLEKSFELILVGKTHDRQSPLLSGFHERRDNAELGAVGQVLASVHFRDKATVLVVQQHNKVPSDNSLVAKNSKKYDKAEKSLRGKSLVRGDDKTHIRFEEDDDSDADSSSDITCIIKGDVSRSHLMCSVTSETSEESAKNFSKMRWVYEPVTPQSNWQSNSEAATKRPAQIKDLLDSHGNSIAPTNRLY